MFKLHIIETKTDEYYFKIHHQYAFCTQLVISFMAVRSFRLVECSHVPIQLYVSCSPNSNKTFVIPSCTAEEEIISSHVLSGIPWNSTCKIAQLCRSGTRHSTAEFETGTSEVDVSYHLLTQRHTFLF